MQQLPIETVKFSDIRLNSNGLTNGRSSVGDVSALQSSIEENGLIDPLVVWKTDDNNLVLIAGYRRHAAISNLRSEVHAEAFDDLMVGIFEGTLEEALAKNLEENVQRQNLNPADEAEAVHNLYEKVGDQTDVAKLVGMSQPWVSQRVNLYRGLIPRGLEYLRGGKVNLKEARRISRLLNHDGSPDETAQNDILDQFDTEEEVRIPDRHRQRVKTYRTKKEFEELGKALADAVSEGAITDVHNAVLSRVIAWHRCEIEMEELLFEEPEIEESEVVEEDIITVAEESAPTPTRRRIRPSAA